MTHPRPWMIVAALLLAAGPAGAKDLPVKVTAARVGLPPGGKATDRDDSGQAAHVSRFACWAPVYVELELAAPVTDPAELLIEAADPDEITTSLVVPINLSGASGKVAGADIGGLGYVRPAGVGEVTVTVRTKDGKPLSDPFRVRSLRPKDPLTYVVLSLGGPPTGFDLPKAQGADTSGGFRGGRVELAAITEVSHLPDHWIGYEGADVVVLHTAASDSFLQKLFGETGSAAEKARRAALAEWVRRGGRLVVAAGANAGLVAQLPALQELLPVAVSGGRAVNSLVLTWSAREASTTSTLSGAIGVRTGTFAVAALAGRPARVLIPPPDRQADGKDVVAAQSPYGLGRVTVVGFDLDRPPFTDFSLRPEFWDWVLREGGANRASAGSDGKPRPASGGLTEEEDEVAVALRTHADTFDGVPVVSFGWVALLIVLYILLIGPVEYYVLKRIVGRPELTWITFPVIVLTVSLAAYFSAYSLKGRDLKVNKIDVIDVDPASGRVYGTTWFTVFSPRIDDYTLGVTPGDGWADAPLPGTAVNWVGAPRGGRASLLRRKYAYHSDANGAADALEKVPIQVWSTKSFVANWSGRFDPSGPVPVVRSDLEHPPFGSSAVSGTFTTNFPVPVLSDCVVFYAGQAYPLPGGTIHSGDTVRLVLDKGVPAAQWLQREGKLEDVLGRVPAYSERPGARPGGPQPGGPAPGTPTGPFPLLGVLFHETSLTHAEGVIPRNASLRRLDQSWRLTADNRHEVILVGRASPAIGPAEETLSGPDAPSRLWLKTVPGTADRTPIPGTGRQETWVRVYLPVR